MVRMEEEQFNTGELQIFIFVLFWTKPSQPSVELKVDYYARRSRDKFYKNETSRPKSGTFLPLLKPSGCFLILSTTFYILQNTRWKHQAFFFLLWPRREITGSSRGKKFFLAVRLLLCHMLGVFLRS